MSGDADELIALFGKITTSDHEQLQQQFSRIMRVEPNVANFYLEASSWNVEVAVHNYLASAGTGDPLPPMSPPQATFTGNLADLQETVLAPGFEPTVELRFLNNGSEPWPMDSYLNFVDGHPEMNTQPVHMRCEPGQECVIHLKLRAPSVPGSFAGTWRLVCSAGYFGSPVWIILNVGEPQRPGNGLDTSGIDGQMNSLGFGQTGVHNNNPPPAMAGLGMSNFQNNQHGDGTNDGGDMEF